MMMMMTMMMMMMMMILMMAMWMVTMTTMTGGTPEVSVCLSRFAYFALHLHNCSLHNYISLRYAKSVMIYNQKYNEMPVALWQGKMGQLPWQAGMECRGMTDIHTLHHYIYIVSLAGGRQNKQKRDTHTELHHYIYIIIIIINVFTSMRISAKEIWCTFRAISSSRNYDQINALIAPSTIPSRYHHIQHHYCQLQWKYPILIMATMNEWIPLKLDFLGPRIPLLVLGSLDAMKMGPINYKDRPIYFGLKKKNSFGWKYFIVQS